MESNARSSWGPRGRVALAAGLGAALLLFFGRACFGGWWPRPPWTAAQDTFLLTTIWERWGAQVRGGHLPLWFSEFQGGVPLHAAWMYGLFYPPVALFMVLPPESAWTGLAILHVALGAAGMFAFLREEGHDDAAAAAGAAVFALSGFLLGCSVAGHLNLVMPLAWAPWVLLATRRCVRGARGSVAALGLAAGVCLVAGHVQMAIYVAVAAAAFAVAEMKACGRFRAALPRLAAAAGLAAAISAIQWVPAIELASVTGTLHEDEEFVRRCSMSARGLAEQAWPRLLCDKADPFDYAYLGLAGPFAVGAALLGLLVAGRRRGLWGGLLVLGLLVSTGTRNPVGSALADLPPFSFVRVPGRAMAIVVLAAAPLAAGVVSAWWTRAKWAAPLAFALSAIVTAPNAGSVRADFFEFDWARSLPPAAAGHRVAVLGDRYPFVERAGVRTLRIVVPVDTPAWRALVGHPTASTGWWLDVGAELGLPWDGPPDDRAATVALAAGSKAASFDAMGRARLFHQVGETLGDAETIARMRDGDRAVRVDGVPDAMSDLVARLRGGGAAWDPDARVEQVETESPSDLEFRVVSRAERREEILVVSEKWYPGWAQWVDGAGWVGVARANVVLMAADASGANVRLSYRPAWLAPALAASAAGLAAAIALLVAARFRGGAASATV